MGFLFGISSGEGLFRQREALEEARSAFLYNPLNCRSMRPVIYDSWLRCLQSGIDPARKRAKDPSEKKENGEISGSSGLCECALPVLTELLVQVQETSHLLILSDAQGRINFLDGDRRVKRQAERINLVPGANWAEEEIGTNAIGTGLKAGNPVQVFAAEHFCEGIHDWVCSSAPIADPLTSEVLGVVDVTGNWREAQTHTLALAMMTAKMVGQEMRKQAEIARQQLRERYLAEVRRSQEDGIVVFDGGFNLVEANPRAREWAERATGRSSARVWSDPELRAYFWTRHRSLGQEHGYEVFPQQLGFPGLIQQIFSAGKSIGFLLILRPRGGKRIGKRPADSPWEKVIGRSPSLLAAIEQCDRVAKANVSILLSGETGSGKELFAQAIYRASERRRGPFVALNCGAVPQELCASELFGYAPGTFTGGMKEGKQGKFKQAQGGILFLDEVGEIPLPLQIHFLRVLQEREVVRLGAAKATPVDVRVIAATHQDLEQLVHDGLFRMDLYYRLNVVSIAIPPLRERREDIPLLSEHFLEELAHKYARPGLKLAPFVREFLANIYPWPGNVRELSNSLEHAVLFCRTGTIMMDDLPQPLQHYLGGDSPLSETEQPGVGRTKTNGDPEREELLGLLLQSGGNLSATARRLGVARTTLYRHLEKCGVNKNMSFN
ncbi:acetoin dehydrogenase operon transcriptional activator AcoR [Peptococcaceae bacterium CEB3]|nr:acetoin dehydrogenase operon transcriptional activator AcoR [Peptococcaceae bacterium CEB3]